MKNTKKTIYLDHAASTPIDARVFLVMKPFLMEKFGNPSTLYKSGVFAKKAIETAREQVAKALFANPDTIVFTSGGTEANNLAVLGVVGSLIFDGKKKPHIITTQIEHSSVLETIQKLEKMGCIVTYLPVDKNGLVSVEEVKKAIKKNTTLISIGYANNEIGTIQPISEIGKMLLQYRKKNPKQNILFHTDACQAVNYCEMSVEKLHVDLMTINSSKIYGPKGAGALFVRRGVALEPIIYGGGQEKGMRSGTENVAAVVGFGKAIEIVEKERKKEIKRLHELQKYFWEPLCKSKQNHVDLKTSFALNGMPLNDRTSKYVKEESVVSGHGNRLVNNLNIHISDIESETLILYLDAARIECSAGSACSADSYGSSHVLRAIGLSEQKAKECVRFTMGRWTNKQDILKTVKELWKILYLLKK